MDSARSEQLIRDYCRTLAAAKSRDLVARERDRLRFFLHAYVAAEWPRDLDRVDGEILRDFLGNWLLRHAGADRADLTAFLDTFRRFYDFLYHEGRLSAPEHDNLIAALAAREYYYDRLDEYHRAVPDAWEDFAAGGPLRDGDPAPALPVDRQLWMLVRNLEYPDPDGPLDFSLFLDYLTRHRVRLTRAGRIPLAHLRRINDRCNTPETIPPRGNMADSRRITWFLRLAETLGLARAAADGRVETTKRAEIFLDLDARTRLAIMVDGSWNRLTWDRLGEPAGRRLSAWAFEHRDGFAALLADLPADREWLVDPNPANNDDPDALLTRYLAYHRVVSDQLLFALREMGLLHFSRSASGAVRSLTLSRLGRRVASLFARRACRFGNAPDDALDRLRDTGRA